MGLVPRLSAFRPTLLGDYTAGGALRLSRAEGSQAEMKELLSCTGRVARVSLHLPRAPSEMEDCLPRCVP